MTPISLTAAMNTKAQSQSQYSVRMNWSSDFDLLHRYVPFIRTIFYTFLYSFISRWHLGLTNVRVYQLTQSNVII